MQAPGTSKAKQSEWYAKNHLGQILCRLCSSQHRDDDNFLVHLESRRHSENIKTIERARAQVAREQEAARALAQQQQHDDHMAQMQDTLGATNYKAPTTRREARVGKPKVVFHTEPNPQANTCKVLFEVSYPLAATEQDPTMRPMHRWVNTHEQNVEEKNDSIVYLLFACEPYETVAYTFPARVPITTADSVKHMPDAGQRYACHWDPVRKVYTLMFTIGQAAV